MGSRERKEEADKASDVRSSNIMAAKAVADAIRTSLGPRGMDKMVVGDKSDITISNDGATIMRHLAVTHPCAKMLVDLSKAQDVEAGDGTSSVVVLCGALLRAAETLLSRGIHATRIADAFLHTAAPLAREAIRAIATPVDVADRATLIQAATTALSSKVVSPNADLLAPIAVDAVLRIASSGSVPASAPIPAAGAAPGEASAAGVSLMSGGAACGEFGSGKIVDLTNIRVVKALGGTLDSSQLIDGVVFTQKASKMAGGPTRVVNAKIALVQFCLSAPKTDMENTVQVSEWTAMDRAIREEQQYLGQLCKKFVDAGCNCILLQKSILRDAVADVSLKFLAQKGIMLVREIERDDIPYLHKALGCTPIAHPDAISPAHFGTAEVVEEITTAEGKLVIARTGAARSTGTASILLRGSSQLVLEEADRSVHDALCVVRSLIKVPHLIPGGGAAESEATVKLTAAASRDPTPAGVCVRAYADALEVIPYTLAENAGLRPIEIVTALRDSHVRGEVSHGVNVRTGAVGDMRAAGVCVLQPLLVTLSAITLATETVATVLKIDDIVGAR